MNSLNLTRLSRGCHAALAGRRRTRTGPNVDSWPPRRFSSPHPPPGGRDDDDDDRGTSSVGSPAFRRNATTFPRVDARRNAVGGINDVIARRYHATTRPERSGVAVVMTLGAIAAAAKAGQYAVQGYDEWRVRRDEEERSEAEGRKAAGIDDDENVSKSRDAAAGDDGAEKGAGAGGASEDDASKGKTGEQAEGKRENIFAKFFDMSVGSKYYEGGFEDKMTRKEAALILGVRESSSAKRIKEAHRKLLILNHPDTGGSTFMAGKINEAKELLLKGKKS